MPLDWTQLITSPWNARTKWQHPRGTRVPPRVLHWVASRAPNEEPMGPLQSCSALPEPTQTSSRKLQPSQVVRPPSHMGKASTVSCSFVKANVKNNLELHKNGYYSLLRRMKMCLKNIHGAGSQGLKGNLDMAMQSPLHGPPLKKSSHYVLYSEGSKERQGGKEWNSVDLKLLRRCSQNDNF